MADPVFAAQVSQRRGELVAEVTGQLTTLSSDAVQVLRECLAADKPSDRMRAAHLILTLASRFRSDTELEARLVEIEARLNPSTGEAA
jgi:hypothetical protein